MKRGSKDLCDTISPQGSRQAVLLVHPLRGRKSEVRSRSQSTGKKLPLPFVCPPVKLPASLHSPPPYFPTRAVSSSALTRPLACVLVLLIWAAIYLPALGSLEIKGEEGRRLLPAVTMLDGGSWIVPQIGGVDYLSKPPLVNWLAAAAFEVESLFQGRGSRSEWAARAPSVLAVLALALTMTAALGGLLTPRGALFAAVCALTNLGLMEKGRLAEIEALYISLYGIALALWLGGWRDDTLRADSGRPPRHGRTWTVPWVFLGLGLLTKGPLHLFFFYAVVLAVVGSAGRWRDLLNRAHLAGVGIMLAIFALWAVPYLHQTAAHRAGGVWLAQFQGRLEVDERFRFGVWLLNIPRGLINFLPWVVLLPLVWRPAPGDWPDADRALLVGGRWAVLGCFLAVSLAPGGQPRYTLPLLVPASILLGLACRRGWDSVEVDGALPPWLGVVWTRTAAAGVALAGVLAPWAALFGGGGGLRWAVAVAVMLAAGWLAWRVVPWKLPPPWERVRPYQLLPLTLASAAAMALLTWDYASGVVPLLRARESVRPAARVINRVIAADPDSIARAAPICVLRPGFVPFLYYLHPPLAYLQEKKELDTAAPGSVCWLLRRRGEQVGVDVPLARGPGWREVATVMDKRSQEPLKNQWVLWRIPAKEQGL